MEEAIRRFVAVLRQSGARWSLVGAHAIGTLTEPRATVDFDFVVEDSKLRRLLSALEEEFGELDVVDMGPEVRLRALDIDLIRAGNHALFQEALRRVREVGDWPIPVPEVLIALKFLAATSPWRNRPKKMQDVADLSALYFAIGRDALDFDLLRQLAQRVYPGAETEFIGLLDKLEHGEAISI